MTVVEIILTIVGVLVFGPMLFLPTWADIAIAALIIGIILLVKNKKKSK